MGCDWALSLFKSNRATFILALGWGKVPGAIIGAVVSGSAWLPDAADSDSVESYLGYFYY